MAMISSSLISFSLGLSGMMPLALSTSFHSVSSFGSCIFLQRVATPTTQQLLLLTRLLFQNLLFLARCSCPRSRRNESNSIFFWGYTLLTHFHYSFYAFLMRALGSPTLKKSVPFAVFLGTQKPLNKNQKSIKRIQFSFCKFFGRVGLKEVAWVNKETLR